MTMRVDMWGARQRKATARCRRHQMNAARDREDRTAQMTLDEGEGSCCCSAEAILVQAPNRSANQRHSDILTPGRSIATPMHNHNDVRDNSTYLRSGKNLKIIGSCRCSRRQLPANFRGSPGTPEALIQALFFVVLLIAVGDHLQERCGSKSLTVFDKFMSWSLWGRPSNDARAPRVVPTQLNSAHKPELEGNHLAPNLFRI
jgi:hypothetical protein